MVGSFARTVGETMTAARHETPPRAITGLGSVNGVPNLPPGFTSTFASHVIDVGGLDLHAVVGGDGPPLLLISGWPQTWYAWRLVMPSLAERYTVVAVDPRGVGRSEMPESGYDTGTLAGDMVALMRSLGHERFAVVGHDVGMWIGYALAADHPASVARLAVAEAVIPGLSPSPPLLASRQANDRLWHFAFNRLSSLNEEMLQGRERSYFGLQFLTKAATPTSIPDYAVDTYLAPLIGDRERLHASFQCYRALDDTMEQNARRRETPLTVPVLAVGGETNTAGLVADTMRLVSDAVTGVIIPGCGHYPAEERPEELLAELLPFLAPYLSETAELRQSMTSEGASR